MLGRHAGRCYLELQANCLTFAIVTIIIMACPGHTFSHCAVTPSHSHLADGCRHVYVDMGTNIGHQIRKVYQPELYPGNPTEPIFHRFFGDHRDSVCSFGFEANPIHEIRLKLLEKSLQAFGKRVHIFSPLAVSTVCANVTFYEDPGAKSHNEWGASLTTTTLTDKTNLVTVAVQAIDIANWMQREVLHRFIPPGVSAPSIVMKSDIEGHDMTVLSHLLTQGVLCDVSMVYGEHLTPDWIASATSILKLANCSTELFYLDDEGGDDSLALPVEVHLETAV